MVILYLIFIPNTDIEQTLSKNKLITSRFSNSPLEILASETK